jgi:UDP-N-acetylglucosamine--N-acetylmuramyl-(pentapeptide) pyrophosphoryl-undecaprenol N-acetylglucosamine transferase
MLRKRYSFWLSLGQKINELVARALDMFNKEGIQVIWQCGKLLIKNNTSKSVKELFNQVHAFLNRMDLAYAAADMVVSRSGALSVSELCLVGKPVILFLHNVEDHQTKIH